MAANPAAARSGGVERVAAGLAARGFGRGDVLALSSPNLPEYALALYGAMAAGGAVTGANPLLTAGELAGQLADAGASALVTVPPFLDVARAAAEKAGVGEVLVFGEAEGATPFASLLTAGDTPPHVRIDPVRDLAALPYSSGTTGLPKGVELTHANLVANARQSQAAVGFTHDDVVVGVAPFFHAMGQNLILPCSLGAGATVVSMPSFDLAGFLGLIQDHRATCTIVVPPIMLALAGHPLVDAYDLSSLRLLGCGAAPLGAEVEQRCADRLGCVVAQGLVMTEGAATFAIAPLDAPRRGSAGRLLGGTQARIVDPDGGGDLGPGRTGEPWLRGPQVMCGYRNHPEATARTITPDGWLRTGDLCYLRCRPAQASRPAASRVLTTMSAVTPQAKARSQPPSCQSSWPGAWASVSMAIRQPASTASRSSRLGGSWRSGRELTSTATPCSAQAPNTTSGSNSLSGRPRPTTIRPVQWPRMSVWGLATAATIRRVISGPGMRSLEWTLATTTSSRASSSSDWSREPSSRMSTSIPVRSRNGLPPREAAPARAWLSRATSSSWARSRSGLRPPATVSRGEWSDTTRYSWPRSRAASAISAIGLPPSDQVEWLWQSPRRAARRAAAPSATGWPSIASRRRRYTGTSPARASRITRSVTSPTPGRPRRPAPGAAASRASSSGSVASTAAAALRKARTL
jgi:hypothetical protein